MTEQPKPPAIPAGMPSTLLERRPDIRAAEQQLIAANARIGAAEANFFPQLSLTSALGLISPQLAQLFTGGSVAWRAGGKLRSCSSTARSGAAGRPRSRSPRPPWALLSTRLEISRATNSRRYLGLGRIAGCLDCAFRQQATL
jgi:multidrug efflux system outer membrane protein